MKRILILTLALVLFFSGCRNVSEEPCGEETTSQPQSAKTQEDSLPTVPDPIPESTENPESAERETDEREDEVLSSGHTHHWKTMSVQDASCTVPGQEVQMCSCGQTRTLETGLLNHAFTKPTCLEAAVCLACGAKGTPALGHTPQNGHCTRCLRAMTSPIFVLGRELRFDASPAEIFAALGTPTETLTEGEFVSFIYASSPESFTVIQTDSQGLWGVFTMDPFAKFFLENQTLSIADFSGESDPNSEAVFRDLATCRVFGFRDRIKGENYAMWLRYEEREYDYMNDPAIFSDYYSQSRLSFYYVNALRARNSISTLLWSDACSQIAVEYSSHMIESGFFGHDNSYLDRLKQKGISYQNAGENLSRGYFNAFFVTDAYYNSESHRRNILDPVFRFVGIGYVKCGGEALSVYGAQVYYS